ncbi:isochorismatase domain-containing protein 2B [Peromyscus maniculatus bairdii]|uniref:isochorismatase domain-containing protein 2B n=1 Tax=Peromyscus maniculatus bairdii TaxID=230844 RepID=UPI003FCEF7A9
MAAARASLGRIRPESSILFLCDMQEKLRDRVLYFPQIVSVAARMLKVARLLDVPVLLTEQYPQGLGPTVPELGAQGLRAISKTCFSMVPPLQQELDRRPQLRSVLLCGIETQGCILEPSSSAISALASGLGSSLPHWALDLLDRGLQVHVAVDACSSRSEMNRLVALDRMRQSGVFLSTSEVLILQLVKDAAHPQFKEIQKIIKEPVPDMGLLSFFQGKSNPLLLNSRP